MNKFAFLFAAALAVITSIESAAQDFWGPPSPELDGFRVEDLDADSKGRLYATIDGSVYVTEDTLQTWSLIYDHLANSATVSDTTVFIADFSEGLFVTEDRSTFSQSLNGIDLRHFAHETPGDPDSGWIAGGGAGQMFRSNDRGASWNLINAVQMPLSDAWVSSISASSQGHLTYTTREVPTLTVAGNGETWTTTDVSDLMQVQWALDRYYAFAGFEVYTSGNGISWTSIGRPEGLSVLTNLAVWNETILATDFLGAFVLSTDGGASWADISAGLDGADPDVLHIGPDGYAYAGLETRVYRSLSPISEVSGTTVSQTPDLPVSVSIRALYPNPTRQSLITEIVLPRSVAIRVSMYDMLGREVALLYEGHAAPGILTLEGNLDLAAGSYTVRVKSDLGIENRQMVVR